MSHRSSLRKEKEPMDWPDVLRRRRKDRAASKLFDQNGGKALQMKEKSTGQTDEERKKFLGKHFMQME